MGHAHVLCPMPHECSRQRSSPRVRRCVPRVRRPHGQGPRYGPAPDLRGLCEQYPTCPGDAPAVPGPVGPGPGVPGSGRRRLHPRTRRPQRGPALPLPRRPADRPRPGPRGTAPFGRAAGPLRRARHPGPRGLRRAARRSGPAGRPPGAGRPLRPRRLLHAARRGRPGLRLRPGRPARHADGPDHRYERGRGPQHLPPGRAGPHPARLRRGEAGQADRLRDRPGTRERAVQHQRPAGRADPRRAAPGRQAHRRQPREAHLPGAAHRGER